MIEDSFVNISLSSLSLGPIPNHCLFPLVHPSSSPICIFGWVRSDESICRQYNYGRKRNILPFFSKSGFIQANVTQKHKKGARQL